MNRVAVQKKPTMSALSQLKQFTTIVADTGDFNGNYFREFIEFCLLKCQVY